MDNTKTEPTREQLVELLQHVGTAQDLGELLERTKGAVLFIERRHADFPEPLGRLGSARVWSKREVADWYAAKAQHFTSYGRHLRKSQQEER